MALPLLVACSDQQKAASSSVEGGGAMDSGEEDVVEDSGVEPGEWLPGGEATNRRLMGRNAFIMPAPNLSAEHERHFYSGNGFFNQAWVEAPASTAARDGLGPLFNARNCSDCHAKDGRGAPPEDGLAPFGGLLLRLSVSGDDGPVPDPTYGSQLQDMANPDVPVEADPVITWEEIPGSYPDGTAYSLLQPTYTITNPGYGDFADGLMVSPRVAPHMIGLGLLEAIPQSRLEDLADPDDDNGDSVSGRIQWLDTPEGTQIGRFGWKGDEPNIDAQVAGAFAGDMGLTSALVTKDDCTTAQTICQEEPHGGLPEVDETVFARVALYARTLAVPVRRNASDETVLRGKRLFRDVGCDDCHTPSHTTDDAAIAEYNGQLIWPYTDLLLHDMGEGLADNRPVGGASGREWKTPPLWSVGLIDSVNRHTRFLHDGRARSLEEAVLWHGGEGLASRDAFMALDVDERSALLTFVEDL